MRTQAAEIEEQFKDHIESGLLEIVSPPASYYPDFNATVKVSNRCTTSKLTRMNDRAINEQLCSLKATLGDSLIRTIWRTKQNLDFAYLMMYCQPKGTYYVQLEDDVLSKPNFITKMKVSTPRSASRNLII